MTSETKCATSDGACKPCWFFDNKALALIARIGVASVFIYLAALKLADPPLFVKSLGAYKIVPTEPPQLINSLAIFMPWAEMLVGICLIAGVFARGAALMALVMLVSFTAVVFWRGMAIMNADSLSFTAVKFDCGCGTGEVYLWSKLLSNTALIVGAFLLVFTRARLWAPLSLERSTKQKAVFAADVAV